MSRRPRATDVDAYVGRRVNERRILLGLTQQDLASAVGPSYQQIHKWCKGVNRIAASRLWDLAVALGVDVNYFFDGLDPSNGESLEKVERTRQTLELTKNFQKINNQKQRDLVSRLARDLVQSQ